MGCGISRFVPRQDQLCTRSSSGHEYHHDNPTIITEKNNAYDQGHLPSDASCPDTVDGSSNSLFHTPQETSPHHQQPCLNTNNMNNNNNNIVQRRKQSAEAASYNHYNDDHHHHRHNHIANGRRQKNNYNHDEDERGDDKKCISNLEDNDGGSPLFMGSPSFREYCITDHHVACGSVHRKEKSEEKGKLRMQREDI
ncbi:hypothetical protein Salat_1372100 [Sesamum alatum]|uniref:Uncharacterized protein n=1 Tax=Sesamum alatum TaxID=300844 RepID=A0AAE2CL03_9LAMI|nr:hypothetical protein Salat_1372100 [Sesamum alatum]